MIELTAGKPTLRMSFFSDTLGRLGRHRDLVLVFALDDLKRTYAGSLLGAVWILVKPLLVVTVYLILFGVVFQTRTGRTSTSLEYLLLLLTGLLPWLAFAESLTAATGCLTANANLITKTLFPIEVLPLSKVLAAMLSGLVGIVLLVGVLLSMGRTSWQICLLPVIVLLQVLFTAGLAWLLATLNLVVRDTTQLVPYALMTWMFLSPVVYTADMVPSFLATLFAYNPVSYFLDSYRALLLTGTLSSRVFVQAAISSLMAFSVGLCVIARVRRIAIEFL